MLAIRVLWLQWRDIKHPWAGGAEVYMHEIVKRMALKGCEVLAFTSGYEGLPEKDTIDGYCVKRLGDYYSYPLYLHKVLSQHLAWADFIVEDTSKIPLYTPIRSRGKPVLAIIHHLNRGIYFEELPLRKALLAYVMEGVMPCLYSLFPKTILIAVSQSTRQELLKLGANPDRVFIVGNAIDHEKYKPRTNSILDQKTQKPTVLYLSRLKKYKQPHHAVLAFKLVTEKIPDAKLIIAGDGELKTKLKVLIRDLKLEGKVDVLGRVGESEKLSLLQKSWVLLQTSKKEGFGITVLEANACGTPTIAYNVPGLRESIIDSKTGLLVPIGDIEALANALGLLNDHELMERMSRGALEWSKQFHWEWAASDAFKLIETTMKGHLKEQS